MDPPVALQRTDKPPSERTNLQNILRTPKKGPPRNSIGTKGVPGGASEPPKKTRNRQGTPKIRAWQPKDPYISESTGGPTGQPLPFS